MKPLLSVLLPVHNSQATLGANVHRVLEVLPDLTDRFELLVIDDGSTDATCEIADELARHYPQVRVARHPKPLGWAAAVAQQVPRIAGEFLMVHCGGVVQAREVVGLWRLREDIAVAARARATAARSGKSFRIDAKNRVAGETPAKALGNLGIHARAPHSSLLLIHRQQLPEFERSLANIPATDWLPAPSKNQSVGSQGVKGPTFLSRIKAFTLGE